MILNVYKMLFGFCNKHGDKSMAYSALSIVSHSKNQSMMHLVSDVKILLGREVTVIF